MNYPRITVPAVAALGIMPGQKAPEPGDTVIFIASIVAVCPTLEAQPGRSAPPGRAYILLGGGETIFTPLSVAEVTKLIDAADPATTTNQT